MDGQYHNQKEQYVKFLQTWINKVIQDKLWNKFIDIHIDDIDKDFKEKDTWLKGSLFLYNCILNIIDKTNYDVSLVIPLSCVLGRQDLKSKTYDALENELDLTPPSFYLFPKNHKNFEDTIKSAKYLEEISNDINFQAFYKEDIEGEENYRTIYLRSI